MAKKTDSFIIRKTVNIGNTATYAEEPIDLGAYVDALGKSVLRILNVNIQMSDNTGTTSEVTGTAAAQFQLVTQPQTDSVLSSNKSVISTGRLVCKGDGGVPSYVSQDFDNLPQLWSNGYLVAVDQIYLGGEASSGFDGNVYCSIAMECVVESLTTEAAMALALSQQ